MTARDRATAAVEAALRDAALSHEDRARKLVRAIEEAGLVSVEAPPSPSPYFAVLPVTADAAHERAAQLREVRAHRRAGEDPKLYATLTATIALLTAALGVREPDSAS